MNRYAAMLLGTTLAVSHLLIVDADMSPMDVLDPGLQQLELKVLQHILTGYNADIRPTKVHTDVLTVTLGVALIQLLNLDEKNQILTTNIWLNQVWVDHKLMWNPAEYDNITSILLPADKIWTPDVLLYNSADSSYYHRVVSTNAIVHFTGNVTWFVSNTYRSTCAIDMRRFPFDRQVCFLKFGSWSYEGMEVDLALITAEGDLSSYVPSTEWELTNMSAKRTVEAQMGRNTYPFITITISLRRFPLFYLFMYLMPCILLTLFSLVGFCLPVESGEKVFLGIKALLSLILFVMTISETMPASFASVPFLTMCYGASMFFISSTTAVQVWTLNLHYRGSRGQKVPPHLQTIFLQWMAPLLCMPPTLHMGLEASAPKNAVVWEQPGPTLVDAKKTKRPRKARGDPPAYGDLRETSFSGAGGEKASSKTQHYGMKLNVFQDQIMKTLGSLCDVIDKSEDRVSNRTNLDAIVREWQVVACVMDRLSFVTMVVSLGCVSIFLLVNYFSN